jgi:hypothetical protein
MDDMELDAWRCRECDGQGQLTHNHPVDNSGRPGPPGWEECHVCNGLGWEGPDAIEASREAARHGTY